MSDPIQQRARQDRLAKALRDNLKRRKAAAGDKAKGETSPGGDDAADKCGGSPKTQSAD